MAKITLAPLTAFDDRAIQELAEVGPIDLYIERQRAGGDMLYAIMHGTQRVGSTLLRIEETPTGERELVIVAAKRTNKSKVFHGGLGFVEDCARKKNIQRVRVHTRRVKLINALLARNKNAEVTIETGPNSRAVTQNLATIKSILKSNTAAEAIIRWSV